MMFPIELEDHASSANFPMEAVPMSFRSLISDKEVQPAEKQERNMDYTKYEEGIYVGYRHFDKNKINVSYPFGYGLSYTEFAYENMEVTVTDGMIHISVQVKNNGAAGGKEVVEIYVSKPDSKIDRPVQELKAFAKTPFLNGGETAVLTMSIPVSDLSFWDEKTSGWKLEEGAFILHAAASFRDIRLSEEIRL
jgi:beta-glucosidase